MQISRLGLEREQVIENRNYRLVRSLGAGGMGEVWAAHDLRLDRPVALKFPWKNDSTTGGDVPGVVMEARHTCVHEHIVRIYGLGRLNDDIPFLVMEYLVGRTLRQERIARGAMSLEQTANIMVQVVSAVAAAHAANIVHLDLKPGNIFLEERTNGYHHAKLLDFGISKRLHGDVHTQQSEVRGTPGYRAPEQASKDGNVGFPSDVWALAVILVECLSGTRLWPNAAENDPFLDWDGSEFLPMVRHAIESLPANVPSTLRDVLLGALRMDPTARISLEAMHTELAHHATILVPPFVYEGASSQTNHYDDGVLERTRTRTRTSTKTRTRTPTNTAEDSRASLIPRLQLETRHAAGGTNSELRQVGRLEHVSSLQSRQKSIYATMLRCSILMAPFAPGDVHPNPLIRSLSIAYEEMFIPTNLYRENAASAAMVRLSITPQPPQGTPSQGRAIGKRPVSRQLPALRAPVDSRSKQNDEAQQSDWFPKNDSSVARQSERPIPTSPSLPAAEPKKHTPAWYAIHYANWKSP